MPEYKLHYFSLRARGEPIRVILHLAGIKYTEVTYDWGSEEWDNAKRDSSKYAFGTMPVLEVDGTHISQTMAILRYLGNKLGYAPDDSLQQARADSVADECQDIVSKYLWQCFLETDPERKDNARKNWFENIVPRELEYFESMLKCNGTGVFVGNKITYADIAFFCTFNDYLAGGKTEVPAQFEHHPMAKSLYQRILNEPNIATYIKRRPDTIV